VEHVIQDASSSDGTVDILCRYDGSVDWVSRTGRGRDDGLDRALRRCRGQIIGVLNADGEYLPNAQTSASRVPVPGPHPAGAWARSQEDLADQCIDLSLAVLEASQDRRWALCATRGLNTSSTLQRLATVRQ
jgi:hypothetical protein